MRQMIKPGGSISAATPEEVAEIIARQFDLQSIEEYTREKGTIALDATGAGSESLAIPAQYDWHVERVTLTTTPSAAATVQFFENAPNPSDMLEVVALGAAGLYSDSFANVLYVGANSQLVVSCTGGPASGQLSFNLQIRLRKRRSAR